ncbi:unnamed protein product [Gongylonema pulchrum]|uniref:Uncharacterized protein n=1 Tax=Gongylonema pulchrum TaxID=637853 RepID=A0A3P6QLR4_9BILA|nr:unnamed protein product [Gongylonema pulchrum]
MQRLLDEAEAAVEAEEMKAARAQTEIREIRAEAETRIQEKEEQFENARENLQHHLEAIQVCAVFSSAELLPHLIISVAVGSFAILS